MSAMIQRDGHPGQNRSEVNSSGLKVDPEETAFEFELTAQDLSEFLELPMKGSTGANPSGGPRSHLHASARRSAPAARAQRLLRLSAAPIGLSLSIVVAGVLIGVAAHRSSTPQRVIDAAVSPVADVAAPLPQPTPPAHDGLPVRFRNPFDHAEVFNFPPGTSVADARAAVADLLMKRARGRLSHRSHSTTPHRAQLAARTRPTVRESYR
jgi:hypothetical protein